MISACSMSVDIVKDGALIPCHYLVWLVPPLDFSNTEHKIYIRTYISIFYGHSVMLRKTGNTPGHKPAVSVLGLLSLIYTLCQNPVGLLSFALKA